MKTTRSETSKKLIIVGCLLLAVGYALGFITSTVLNNQQRERERKAREEFKRQFEKDVEDAKRRLESSDLP